MHMLIMMINFNYKILSPTNDEFQMRISSEKSKGTTDIACIRRLFRCGYETYLPSIWGMSGFSLDWSLLGKAEESQDPCQHSRLPVKSAENCRPFTSAITCSELHLTCCAPLQGLLPGAQHHTEMGSRAARMEIVRAQLAHNNWNKLTTVLTTLERDAQRHVLVIGAHHHGTTEQFLSRATVPLKFLLERCNGWHSPRRDHNSSWPCVDPRPSWTPMVVVRLLTRTVLDIQWQKNLKFQPSSASCI